jgi:hypothetical protein
MLNRRCFQPRWNVVLLLALGCAGSESDDDEGSMLEVAADDGTCTLDDGTYLFSYPPISGDCGPFPDEVLVVQEGGGFTAGMSDEVDCDETISCDRGNLVVQSRCTATLSGNEVEIRRLFTFDVETMAGVLDFRVLDASSAGACSSTYRVSVSTQDGSGGTDGGGGGASGASGDGAGAGGSDCTNCGTLPNGEECEQDADCISQDCGASMSGESFCYGDAALGADCRITQDCRTGICVDATCVDPETLPEDPNPQCETPSDCASGVCVSRIGGTSDRVCLDGLEVCRDLGISGTCFEDLAVVSCQSRQICEQDDLDDFDRCIAHSCMWWYENLTEDECPGQLNYMIERECP